MIRRMGLKKFVFFAGLLLASGVGALAIITDLTLVEQLHEGQIEHTNQKKLFDLVASGQQEEAFDFAFDQGNELFETEFNAIDGIGGNVGQGQRFTRVPRADLNGPDQWANHFPPRATGPNAQSCTGCHNRPADDGAGAADENVHRDPFHSGILSSFIERNTPHTFAPGALQRLAEEMTQQLAEIRKKAANKACNTGQAVYLTLTAKGVDFGKIGARPQSISPCQVEFDTSGVEGVDADLVIRPFQWKGSEAFIRSFNRGASHNEIGMQAVEIVGYGVDGDFDGVSDEMTIGDQTALAVYLAAQPRPVSKLELSDLGLIPPVSDDEAAQIQQGFEVFKEIGCDTCHRPELRLNDPIFREPSLLATHRDKVFPSGLDPVTEYVDPNFPVSFDLTADQPDNIIILPDGKVVHLGSLEVDIFGRAIVRLFGDLKRHDMGPGLAETIDETGSGASVWITKELWGVGTTAPYLHDGRATTLTEAILEHGGESNPSRIAFENLPLASQQDLIAFLNSLMLFKVEAGE